MNPLEMLQNLTPQELAIGSGVTFPINITKKTRRVWDKDTNTYKDKEVSGWYPELGSIDLIRNNLESLLVYNLGFRIRQETFGNNLESVLEEPNTQALNFYIKHEIRSLFSIYEPRIFFKNMRMQTHPAGLIIQVTYGINSDVPIEDYLNILIPNNS